MEELYDAILELKRAVQKQNELQEEANNIMRALVEALNTNSQVMEDTSGG